MTSGLSNISYGQPARQFMNQTFITIAIVKDLDGAIINRLDGRMRATTIAAEALAGRDNFCMSYLNAFRAFVFE
jgi:5-methyltetrahydrofolate--homocysteine methyltransferase